MKIILWEVPNFYIDQVVERTTEVYELNSAAEPGSGRSIGKMPLLYREDGSAITVANNWLIHLKANVYKKEVNTQAQGLLHYFTFLDDIQYQWDQMPSPLRLRPTYAFKKHLKEAFKSGVIARSTANSYMRVVINFYKFYLFKKHPFDNPPFNYEFIKISTPGRYDFMQNKMMHVDSTDLRLNLPRDSRYNGLSRSLVPLSDREWQDVESFLINNGRGVVKHAAGSQLVAISPEFKLAVYLARYSGLRRDEVISLRARQIYRPDAKQLSKKYLIHAEGLLLDPQQGIRTKGGITRYAEMPSTLMNELHNYVNSARYITRKKKFIQRHPDDADNPPILLSQNGDMFSAKTIDARWGELRNALSSEQPVFEHKFHNLRSTYAVFRLKELLNNGLREADALDYLQAMMGHKHRTTLLAYLRFCKQDKSANEVYEEALDLLLEGA